MSKYGGYKISKEAVPQIIKMYTEEMIPMTKIAEVFGVSRAAIHKIIRKTGTPTQKGIASRRSVECHNCHSKFELTRSRMRERGNNRSFCSRECYDTWLRRNGSKVDRNGSRIARDIIESIYGPLPEGSIVHHIDCNANNNSIANLMLLKCQADHIKIHRETDPSIVPLFDGRLVGLPVTTIKKDFEKPMLAVYQDFDVVGPIPTDPSLKLCVQTLISVLKTRAIMRDIKYSIIRNFGDSPELQSLFEDPYNYIAI